MAAGPTPQELELFINSNKEQLVGEALEVFRKMCPADQRRVINEGGLRDCMNVTAVIKTRARKARDMETVMSGGKLPTVAIGPTGPRPSDLIHDAPMELAQAYFDAPLAEVKPSERRFGTAASTSVQGQTGKGEEDTAKPEAMVGDVRGVGGVIEVTKAKFGCAAMQRLRVVGQTPTIWQCEGGKTIPKHNNVGWRWVLNESEAAKPVAEKKQTVDKPVAIQQTLVTQGKVGDEKREAKDNKNDNKKRTQKVTKCSSSSSRSRERPHRSSTRRRSRKGSRSSGSEHSSESRRKTKKRKKRKSSSSSSSS